MTEPKQKPITNDTDKKTTQPEDNSCLTNTYKFFCSPVEKCNVATYDILHCNCGGENTEPATAPLKQNME